MQFCLQATCKTRSSRHVDLLLEHIYFTFIDFTLIHLSGVFTLGETLITKFIVTTILVVILLIYSDTLGLYAVFNVVAALLLNVVELYFDQCHEFSSFNSLMEVDKSSTNLSQFINRLLPLHCQDIINRGVRTGEMYQNVTLLFADIVGFTAYSAGKKPRQVVQMLSSLFTNFDKECDRLNLFKIYTIGDCYVVMSFVDNKNRRPPREEAHSVAQLAISMLTIIGNVRKKIKFDKLNMRIGIHTGNVYGGVMGTELVRFDLYGEDVVIANKMESGGEQGRICVSESTKNLLEQVELANYTFIEHQEVTLKSSGRTIMSHFMNLDQFMKKEVKDENDLDLELENPS